MLSATYGLFVQAMVERKQMLHLWHYGRSAASLCHHAWLLQRAKEGADLSVRWRKSVGPAISQQVELQCGDRDLR
jgi:hypothetical protein